MVAVSCCSASRRKRTPSSCSRRSASTTAALLTTSTRQVEYAGVLAGAANPEGARAFITWMLSAAVQTSIPENMYMYPVDDAVALPEEWEQNAPLVEDPIVTDPAAFDARREGLLKEWTALAEEVQGS